MSGCGSKQTSVNTAMATKLPVLKNIGIFLTSGVNTNFTKSISHHSFS
jgi:hypothetical protein